MLVACVLVAGVAAWVTTPAEPENDNVVYTATHQLLRDSSAAAPPAIATVSLFVKTGEVPERAAERLDYSRNPAVLAAGITLEPDEQVGTLDLTAKGSSPEQAAERANVFAEETLAFLGQQATQQQQEQIERVNEQLATLQAELDALDDELEAAETTGESTAVVEAQRDSKLRQYGAALDLQEQALNQPPPSAGYITLQPALPELATQESGGFSAPQSRPARTALAMAVGLLLGLAAVLLVERLDTRLHDAEATGAAFQLPVIAEIPVAPRGSEDMILTDIDPMSSMAEGYRTLRSSVLLSPITILGFRRREQRTENPQVLLVTSPAPGDGKTTTVANLAAAMAEAGRSVLVLGCDFRRPEIHKFFDVPASPGIADVLKGERALPLERFVQRTAVPGISVAPSGSKLRSFGDVAAAGRDMVDQARELADLVIIDTAPILATNDASELIPACDAVIIVSRVGKTTADSARRTRALLERLGAPVSGVVAVAVPDSDTAYSSYYHSAAPVETRRGGRRARRRRDNDEDLSGRIRQFRGSAELTPAAAPATSPTTGEPDPPATSHTVEDEPVGGEHDSPESLPEAPRFAPIQGAHESPAPAPETPRPEPTQHEHDSPDPVPDTARFEPIPDEEGDSRGPFGEPVQDGSQQR